MKSLLHKGIRPSLLLLTLLLPLNAYSQTLNMVISESAPLKSESMPQKGQFSAVSAAIFERAGYQIDLTFLPYKKARTEARKGSYDGIIGDYYTKDRARNFHFTNAVYRIEKIFVQNKDRGISFLRMDELKRFKVASVADTAYTEDLRGFGINTLEVDSDLAALKLLADEQIDLALIGKPQLKHQLKQPQLVDIRQDLEVLDRGFKFYDLFCSVTKQRNDGKTIVERFNKAMKEMKQDGSYQKLLHQNGLRKRAD